MVSALPNFAPATGNTFRLIGFASKTGDFTNPPTLPALPPGRTWQQNWTMTEFNLVVN